MTGIARTLHLLGTVFWIGGMGARLVLLGSVTAQTPESVRGQLYDAQRRVHLRMEVPAFLLALLAGLFLMYAGGITFRQTWFSVKVLLLVGVIFVDFLASRRFRAIRASADAGGAAGLTSALVLLALLMVFAAVTKF
jgi:uncharacterized membrane protein